MFLGATNSGVGVFFIFNLGFFVKCRRAGFHTHIGQRGVVFTQREQVFYHDGYIRGLHEKSQASSIWIGPAGTAVVLLSVLFELHGKRTKRQGSLSLFILLFCCAQMATGEGASTYRIDISF